MKTKEEYVVKLFFEYPLKQWHFEELVLKSKLARSKVANWLKKLENEQIIIKIKEEGKMPYFVSNYNCANYQNKKKLFALKQLEESGFLNYLGTLNAETIILFGSYSRSDWYYSSDIDLFLYKFTGKLNLAGFENKTHKELHIIECNNFEDLRKLGSDLLRNIIEGNIIKGNINFIRVEVNDGSGKNTNSMQE